MSNEAISELVGKTIESAEQIDQFYGTLLIRFTDGTVCELVGDCCVWIEWQPAEESEP